MHFDFASISSHTRMVNANRLQVHALAYNIAKVIHSARYNTFKLCSSCPYKNEFYETLSNIGKLNVQPE